MNGVETAEIQSDMHMAKISEVAKYYPYLQQPKKPV
jgi:hypothetical protein